MAAIQKNNKETNVRRNITNQQGNSRQTAVSKHYAR